MKNGPNIEKLEDMTKENLKNVVCPFCDSPPKTLRSIKQLEDILKEIKKKINKNLRLKQ